MKLFFRCTPAQAQRAIRSALQLHWQYLRQQDQQSVQVGAGEGAGHRQLRQVRVVELHPCVALAPERIQHLHQRRAIEHHNGWENTVKDADALPYIAHGSQARTSDANGTELATLPLAPMREEDAPNEELREAWEYYHTPRAQHANAPGFMTARSLPQIITYDAYHKAEAFLTQPILTVAGSVAGSKWMSDDLLARAASTDKQMHVIEGANHMSLYDKQPYVDEAVSVLAQFFQTRL